MGQANSNQTSQELTSLDDEAIRLFRIAIQAGKHWYLGLLEAVGRWSSPEETFEGRLYQYLIEGAAFDWQLLAERLCEAVNGLLPEKEKSDFLLKGKPPLDITKERKERHLATIIKDEDTTAEAFQRIYAEVQPVLLEQFRKEKHHRRLKSISLSELKQFTYWLFMYRIKHNDKSRVASDTKKALDWLNRNGYPDRFIITRPLVGNRK